MPFGPVSTDPTLGSVADASLSDVAETPDPVGVAFVVVGELCDAPHAVASTAIATIDPISPGYRSRALQCRPGDWAMVACVRLFIASDYRGGTPFVHQIHNFPESADLSGVLHLTGHSADLAADLRQPGNPAETVRSPCLIPTCTVQIPSTARALRDRSAVPSASLEVSTSCRIPHRRLHTVGIRPRRVPHLAAERCWTTCNGQSSGWGAAGPSLTFLPGSDLT